jgi:ATP synthase protein I
MERQQQPNKKKSELTDLSNRKRFQDYGKYAGMALQMGATIAIGVWGGMKLDEKFPFAKLPFFTLIFSLLAVIGSMYFVIKDLLKK